MDATTAYLLGITLLMGVAFAALIALIALRRAGPFAATIAGVGWYAGAFALFAWRFAAPRPESFLLNFGLSERPLDYGGAVPFCIALAAGALAVHWLIPHRAGGEQPPGELSLIQLLIMCSVWIGWMVASEQDITQYTAVIATNSIASVLAAVAASLLVEFVRRRSISRSGVQLGVVAGLAAATASCAYLDPASAIAVGLIAGGASSLIAMRKKASGSLTEAVAVPVASGAIVGLLSLGLLDQTRGFFYTGQPDLTLSQCAVICLSGGFAFAVSAVVMLIARLAAPKSDAAKQGSGQD